MKTALARLCLCLSLLTGIVYCGIKSPPLPPLKPASTVSSQKQQAVSDSKKDKEKTERRQN